MASRKSLEDLLEQAAKEYDVKTNLLRQILQEERLRLYLFDSPRSSVLEKVRRIIQEEVEKRK